MYQIYKEMLYGGVAVLNAVNGNTSALE